MSNQAEKNGRMPKASKMAGRETSISNDWRTRENGDFKKRQRRNTPNVEKKKQFCRNRKAGKKEASNMCEFNCVTVHNLAEQENFSFN